MTRRLTKRRRSRGWTEAHRQQLMDGCDLFEPSPWGVVDICQATGEALEDIKRCWKEHGESITREYVRDRPGHRPAAWWLLDCPSEEHRGDDPSYVEETSILREMGVLSDWEEQQLKRHEERNREST